MYITLGFSKNRARTLLSVAVAGVMLSSAFAVQADKVSLIWQNMEKRPSIGVPADSFQLTIQAFEKQNPDISVENIYGTSWVTQLLAGAGPDVIGDCCDRFHNAGIQGGFLDLTPFLGTVLPDYMKEQEFWPPQWSAFNANGHQFGLPLYLGTIAMYANTDMFGAAGVAVPSADLATNHVDWNAFEALCKKLTKIDASGRVRQYGFAKASYQDRFGYWMLAAGAKYYVDGDPYQSALASPQAVEALTYLQRLKTQDNCMNLSTSQFYNDHAAMMEDVSSNIGRVIGATETGAAKVPFHTQFFPMPIGPSGQRYTLATIDGLAVNRNTKHPKEALALLRFAAGKEAEEMRAKYNGLQPARKDVVPEYLNLMDAMNHQAFKIEDHVFTDAGPYAYPQYLYADMNVANSLFLAAFNNIFNHDAPVTNTWYTAVEALNARLAQLKTQGNTKPVFPTSASYEPVDVRAMFNNKGISTTANSAKANLDGGGYSLAAEGLPASGSTPTIDGVPFQFPTINPASKDNWSGDGKTLTLPAGKYNAIYLLGTGTSGSQMGLAKLSYADGSTDNAFLAFSDWCKDPSNGEKQGPRPKVRHKAGADKSPACGIFVQALNTDSSKTLTGFSLPENEKIHVFAITLGKK